MLQEAPLSMPEPERCYGNARAVPDGYRKFVRVSYPRHIVTIANFTNFKCPKVDCKTFYLVSLDPEPPKRPPRCAVCGTPFLARDGEQYLVYLRSSSASKVTA